MRYLINIINKDKVIIEVSLIAINNFYNESSKLS